MLYSGELEPGPAMEKPLGKTDRSVFMVWRGIRLPEAMSFFGLGAPDKSEPDPYKNIEAISQVLTGSKVSPYAFAIYDTRLPFTVEDAFVDTEGFLDTEIAVSFTESLADVCGILGGKKVPSSYESYSGSLFFALLGASFKYPDHPRSVNFLSSLGKIGDRVAVFAPAVGMSHYKKPAIEILRKIAMEEDINLFLESLAKMRLNQEMNNVKKSGHFLDRKGDKMLQQYLARVRHLVLFERVYKDFLEDFDVPADIKLPSIVVVHHRDDGYVDYEETKALLTPLETAGLIEFRTAGDEFVGKDKHCLYALEENRPKLRRITGT